MAHFIEGFLLQASLILALGAQNLFVLESGLKKQRHLLVALICTLCDVLLIGVGVAGAASIFVRVPGLKIAFGLLGVGFLVYYGLKKLSDAFKMTTEGEIDDLKILSLRDVVLLTLSFSLLNPHVYLDTVVLIGGYSAQFERLTDRAWFGVGAACMSAAWFLGLAIFSFYLSAVLSSPRSMRFVSLVSGVVLILLSFKLGRDVYHWLKI